MEEQGNKFIQLSSAIEDSQGIEIQNEGSPHKEPPSKPKQVENNVDKMEEIPTEEVEEVQSSEDSEEEGEIAGSQSSARRSLRGRKTAYEKREQETYKDKLQGSQPTLEKLLAKTPKMTRNQHQSSKGAPHSKSK